MRWLRGVMLGLLRGLRNLGALGSGGQQGRDFSHNPTLSEPHRGSTLFLPKFHSYVSTSVMLLSYYYFSLLPVFCDTHDDHEGANLDQSCQQ